MYISGCNSSPGPGIGWWQQAVSFAIQAASTFEDNSDSTACWTRYNNRPFLEPCPNTPNYDAVVRAVTRGPQADIDKIVRYLLTTNQGSGPRNRADLARPECVPFWVKAILGGKGCVASTYPEAPGWFIQFVKDWGTPQNPTEAQPGSTFLPDTPGTLPPTAKTTGALMLAGLSLFFLPKLLGRK